MAEVEVLIGVSVRPWADAVHRFCEDHGGARVRARVIDEAAALAHAAQVVLVDDTASFLTGRLVERLHARGTGVLVVVDATQFSDVAEWVGRLGVDAVVPDDEAPDRIIAAAVSVAGPGSHAAAGPAERPPRRGAVLAVAGVSGGVGATEIAVAIADAVGSGGLLADLDLSSPSVAQRLALPLHPNVRSAVDAHRGGQPLDPHFVPVGGFDVLVGPAASGDWAGLDVDDVRGLLESVAERRTVVVNLPAGPPRRHPHGAVSVADVSRPLLGMADVVIAVTLPSPVGVSRAFEWMAAADGVVAGRLHLALNRSPASAFRRAEAKHELERALEVPVWMLPEDARVGRAAWAGHPVGAGRFRRAARKLVGSVAA